MRVYISTLPGISDADRFVFICGTHKILAGLVRFPYISHDGMSHASDTSQSVSVFAALTKSAAS